MPEERIGDDHTGDCQTVVELKTTVGNAKWAIGATAGIVGLIVMFFGWVATDNLTGIRGDLKEAKGMLQSIQRDQDKLNMEVTYLKAWRVEVEEHMKRGNTK